MVSLGFMDIDVHVWVDTWTSGKVMKIWVQKILPWHVEAIH